MIIDYKKTLSQDYKIAIEKSVHKKINPADMKLGEEVYAELGLKDSRLLSKLVKAISKNKETHVRKALESTLRSRIKSNPYRHFLWILKELRKAA